MQSSSAAFLQTLTLFAVTAPLPDFYLQITPSSLPEGELLSPNNYKHGLSNIEQLLMLASPGCSRIKDLSHTHIGGPVLTMLLRGHKARKHPQEHQQSPELVLCCQRLNLPVYMHNMNVLLFYRVQHLNLSIAILQVASCVRQKKTIRNQVLQNHVKLMQTKAQENSLYHGYNKYQTPVAKCLRFFSFSPVSVN